MFWIFTTVQRSGVLNDFHNFKTKSVISIYRKGQIFERYKHNYLKVHFRQKQLLLKHQLQDAYVQKHCCFRTTSTLYLSPLFTVILRSVLKISPFFLGRRLKRWWHRKSDKEKKEFIRFLKTNRNVFFGSLALVFFSALLYYIMHIQIDPITGRRRFLIFNEAEQTKLGELMLETHHQMHQKSFLSNDHPTYNRLAKIVNKILKANQDLIPVSNKPWTLTVIDSPLKNAYVLPVRNIVFFSGILDIMENDDQLAIVIAHEMAHDLLLHSFERLSNTLLLDVILAIPILLMWALFPVIMASFLLSIAHLLLSILYTLPYSRALENEADDVGLKLAAKACVDVREAVVLWGMMRTLTEMELNAEIPEIATWLSTHPAHGDREQNLNKKLPEAIKLMKISGCPDLNPADPRQKFYRRSKKDHERYFKEKGLMPD